MRPLKITALLQDGRVAGTEPWFPLDSILAAEWMRRTHPDAYYNAGSHLLTHDLIEAELPFERRGGGEDWYWACSFNAAALLSEYVLHWHKRFDDQMEQYIDFGGRRGKVDVKSSRYKAYRMPLVVQLFDRLEWYAVGDPDAIFDLCRSVTHIGKKTSQGLGLVDYWTVESWPEDWSEYRGGGVMRALPLANGLPEGTGAQVAQYGIRSPYWHADHARVCYMPEVRRG